MIDHRHPHRVEAPRDRLADAAEAHDAHRAVRCSDWLSR